MNETPNITALLGNMRNGDRAALDELMPYIFDELRRMALGQMRAERRNHTLQATALVNEVYLQLAGQRQAKWQNRAHFFAAAAEMMRRILVSYARKDLAAKRGGDAIQVSLSGAEELSPEMTIEVLVLDEALQELADFDPGLSRLVELRYFGGLSIEATAEAMGVSTATVKRHWNTARAWLHRRITLGRRGRDQ